MLGILGITGIILYSLRRALYRLCASPCASYCADLGTRNIVAGVMRDSMPRVEEKILLLSFPMRFIVLAFPGWQTCTVSIFPR